MSVTAACEAGEHDRCLRPSCDCWCGHVRRAELHAAADRLMRREVEPCAPVVDLRPRRQPRPSSGRRVQPDGHAVRSLPAGEIARLYAAGTSTRQLAARFGVAQETMRLALRQAGVPMRASGGGSRRVKVPSRRLAAAYERGVPMARLAARYGCSENTVRLRLLDEGVALRPKGVGGGPVKGKLPADRIVERYRAGESLKRLAREYRVATGTLRGLLVGRGVTIRATGRASV